MTPMRRIACQVAAVFGFGLALAGSADAATLVVGVGRAETEGQVTHATHGTRDRPSLRPPTHARSEHTEGTQVGPTSTPHAVDHYPRRP